MYQTILILHSCVRWLVVTSLLLAIYIGYSGWITKKGFTKMHNSIRHNTATIAHVQLVLGVLLYFISPIIEYFLNQYKEAVKIGEIRFFGMEHSLMMLVAIIVITMGSIKSKRKTADIDKFKTMAIWYTVALLIIFISIPWPFSPLASRPWFRFS